MSRRLSDHICICLAFILAASPLRFAAANVNCVDTHAGDFVTVLLHSTSSGVLEEHKQRGHYGSLNEMASTGHQNHDATHCTPGHVCPAIVGVEHVGQPRVRHAQTPRYCRRLRFKRVVFLPFKPPCL